MGAAHAPWPKSARSTTVALTVNSTVRESFHFPSWKPTVAQCDSLGNEYVWPEPLKPRPRSAGATWSRSIRAYVCCAVSVATSARDVDRARLPDHRHLDLTRVLEV